MKAQSESIKAYFQGQTDFTSVMEQRFFALAAPSSTERPFACFRIVEEPLTKDGDACLVSITAFFKPEQYVECVAFLDAMKPLVKEKYEWISSEADIDDEDLSYIGIINFKI